MGTEHQDAGTPSRLNRRRLLGVSAAAAISAATISLIPTAAFASDGKRGDDRNDDHGDGGDLIVLPSRRGIILYTVRDVISRAPDPASGLKGGFRYVFEELARMGYKEVEFAGYTQHPSVLGRQITPAEIRQLLNDNGLVANGSHIGFNFSDPASFAAQLDIAQTLGMPHLGTASIPTNSRYKADWQRAADNFNTFGEMAKARGIKLYQHNHHAEYNFLLDAGPPDANGNPTRSSGLRALDYFFTLVDPKLVYFEMDIYWGYVARHRYQTYTDANGVVQTNLYDPVKTVKKRSNRFRLFHVKDGVPADNADGYSMVPAGTGVIPLQKFLDAVGERGLRHPNYEQDNAPGGSAAPSQSLQFSQTSYTNIASWRSKEDNND
jgi:sugar phosphate isomerase/epimerase